MDWNKYDEKMLNGCLTGLMKLGCFALVIFMLLGCKTKEFVYLEKTDTLFVARHDTVREKEVRVERHDSIVHDSVIVKQDSAGKPIEIHHWHKEKVTDIQRDSVDKYKAKCDSLRQKLKNTQNKKEVVTKTDYSGWWAFLLLLVAAGVTIFLFVRHYKRR